MEASIAWYDYQSSSPQPLTPLFTGGSRWCWRHASAEFETGSIHGIRKCGEVWGILIMGRRRRSIAKPRLHLDLLPASFLSAELPSQPGLTQNPTCAMPSVARSLSDLRRPSHHIPSRPRAV